MASPQALNDVRLRLDLARDLPDVSWPSAFALRSFVSSDAPALHALLDTVFADGADGPFDTWWERVRTDPEFDPDLCLLAFDGQTRLVGAALAWNTGFLKDLAVLAEARQRGLGRALALSLFHALQSRGLAHVDLKTNLVSNAEAVRLYHSFGMVEVGWEG
jgi:ribosomal protein S18 acetylase RimI-like enzyme